jgi:hypothetical protein
MVYIGKDSYTAENFYQSYLKNIDRSTQYDIPRPMYYKIVKDYFIFLSNNMLAKGMSIKLPARMGTVLVEKSKINLLNRKSLSVDFNLTKKYGKTIYHTNEHSDGYKYLFRWRKSSMMIENKSMYELVACRANKRLLAKYIKENRTDYIEC